MKNALAIMALIACIYGAHAVAQAHAFGQLGLVGGAHGPATPPQPGNILRIDAVSQILRIDGTSNICRLGGC